MDTYLSVPAEYVATNTLKLVNFCYGIYRYLTVVAAVCVMLGISFVMRRNQTGSDSCGAENNARLKQ